jgi:hypothetical protein
MPRELALIHKEIHTTSIRFLVSLMHIKFPYKEVETGWQERAQRGTVRKKQ